jgi:hypothetical protein
MADNVGITPGSGAKAASREVTYSGESAQVQVVGLSTFSGSDDAKTVADVSASNPLPVAGYGELIEAIEALRMAMHSLTRSAIGQIMPDTVGTANALMRIPVLAQNPTAANLTATVSLAASQTLATLTNQTQIGGFAAVDQVPALLHLQADNLRRNIVVT